MKLRKEEFSAENQYGWAMENGKNNTQIRFTIIYSTKAYAEIESLLNLFKTLFICCVLGIAAHYFTKDASTLVLEPLERMIEKVQLIAKNPLAAATDQIDQAGVMSFAKADENKESQTKEEQEQSAQYETAVLEKAIVKIGHLLALGFGEAGAGIIG